MPHLVKPIENQSIQKTVYDLRVAHRFLVECATNSIEELSSNSDSWGIKAKRLKVALNQPQKPYLVDKTTEILTEVVNITATMERLIDALEWFASHDKYDKFSVLICHPSTSDNDEGNDLVLIDSNRRVCVRCEVCDVASSNAGQNNKENKDIKNLGIDKEVPVDGVERFIATSEEFASALVSKHRKWNTKPYRYEMTAINNNNRTCMLRILPNDQG